MPTTFLLYAWRLKDKVHSTWRYVMETLSTLPVFCEGNPPVTGGFPSQSVSNAMLWRFRWVWSNVKQTVKFSGIRDAMLWIWRHYNTPTRDVPQYDCTKTQHPLSPLWPQLTCRWTWYYSTRLSGSSSPNPREACGKKITNKLYCQDGVNLSPDKFAFKNVCHRVEYAPWFMYTAVPVK